LNRRQFLFATGALGAAGIGFAGNRFWPESGFKNPCLSDLPDDLKNYQLMHEIWADIDPAQVWDVHVHVTGTGESGTGPWMNPNMNSWLHPTLKIQKEFYTNGSCSTENRVDVSYVERLVQLSAEMPPGYKSLLFAFDWFHSESGKPLEENSIFHVPDAYVASIAKKYPQFFEWVASIHPYRADALDALDKARAEGAKAIKWLPSGMGIDPASPKCDAFYKKLADLRMPIISHTGRESAVQGGDQRHGNPLRMRRALDHGVRVALAHCASDGHDEDLDNDHKRTKSIELFMRLMDTPDYKKLVFGEISALALINHAWAIKPLLERTDLHDRLLNGSDYPLPGILPLVSLKQLIDDDLLDKAHVEFLKTIRLYNPLLFDFAVKRLLKFQNHTFPARVFETKKFFS
jgi:uncharacterized protein